MEYQSYFDDWEFENQCKGFTQHEQFGSFVNLLCDMDQYLESSIPSDILKLDPEDIPICDPVKIVQTDTKPSENDTKSSETAVKLDITQIPPKAERLSLQQRKEKVEKFLAKRRKRPWHKKFDYSGRRRVAEKRLRIKGRFISKEQAKVLGLDKIQPF
ncbi:unnamed protein product [Blepharisma stoltei]|uniref:CCT domain-containing protein n=1 Tax=Blepharisma stoltei TaxID=1481888 RepID=A0AAU9IZ90_9CILI|nr:unnamed protein product [Blepharisma stoltei]